MADSLRRHMRGQRCHRSTSALRTFRMRFASDPWIESVRIGEETVEPRRPRAFPELRSHPHDRRTPPDHHRHAIRAIDRVADIDRAITPGSDVDELARGRCARPRIRTPVKFSINARCRPMQTVVHDAPEIHPSSLPAPRPSQEIHVEGSAWWPFHSMSHRRGRLSPCTRCCRIRARRSSTGRVRNPSSSHGVDWHSTGRSSTASRHATLVPEEL